MQHLFLSVLDLGGTFVFAISGGVVAVRKQLDVFGAVVLAFCAGNAGGITRDVLIGATPPAAIASWHYMVLSLLAGLLAFFWYEKIERWEHPVQWLDAIGLAFFAVTGTEKSLEFGIIPPAAAVLGMLTGIGGGMLRDVLANRIPVVLHSDLYAMAALAGSVIVVAGNRLGLATWLTGVLGAALCLWLRSMAISKNWRLPLAHTQKK